MMQCLADWSVVKSITWRRSRQSLCIATRRRSSWFFKLGQNYTRQSSMSSVRFRLNKR